MKMMIWKELRENAKWAALGGGGLLLAEVFALSSWRRTVSPMDNGVTLCSDTFLMVSAFGCAAIGLALGLLQIVPERARDRWASLLHRPVPVRQLFWGKAIAGLLLLAIAAGLPCLLCVLWVARPGYFPAPFLPDLAVPAASDLLLGGVCYLTAMLLALSRGSWWGQRGAVACFAAGIFALHFIGYYHAAPAILGLVAAGVAASAAFQNVNRPWHGKAAIALIFLFGLVTACQWTGTGLQKLLRQPRPSSYYYPTFQIARDGAVFILQPQSDNRAQLMDLQGRPVTDERYTRPETDRAFLYLQPLGYRAAFESGSSSWDLRSPQRYVQAVGYDNMSPEIWYLLTAKKYYVGYDKRSGRAIGLCDAEGFKAPDAVPHPFADLPQQAGSFSLLVSGSRLYRCDFAERRLTLLLEGGNGSRLQATEYPYPLKDPRTAVAMESGIRILGSNGAPLFEVPYGHDAQGWPQLSVTSTTDYARLYLQYGPSMDQINSGRPYVMHLDVLDAEGRLIETHTTPPASYRRKYSPGWGDRLARLTQMPGPSLLTDLGTGSDAVDGKLSQLIDVNGPYFAKRTERTILVFLALGCGVLAALWARRASLSRGRTSWWIACAMLFGVAGLLAFRLAVTWSAIRPCPACHRTRSVRRTSCPHCHSDWPTPAANGAEIFEPMAGESAPA